MSSHHFKSEALTEFTPKKLCREERNGSIDLTLQELWVSNGKKALDIFITGIQLKDTLKCFDNMID